MTPKNQESAASNQDINGQSDVDAVSQGPFGGPSRTYVDSSARPRVTVHRGLLTHPRIPPLRDVASRRSAATGPCPHQNQILAGLPLEDYQRLHSRLEPITLRPGLLFDRAANENDLYFPTAGIVSRYCVTQDGATAELAATGREGAVGIAACLGGDAMVGEAVALTTGTAYRLRGDLVKAEFERHRALPRVLLRYTQVLMAHIAQIAVCNRHHSLEQQLCRWILSSKDRLASNELTVTHETIARMLGVRREGVTRTATKLRNAGLIAYSRGHISIINPQLLEAGACECHAVIKQAYERLHQPTETTACAARHRAIDSARSLSTNRISRVLPLRTLETL